MEIKHIIFLISIFYLLSSSTSTTPEAPDSTPESPDSTPESPDSTPESPDSTPESPDSTPESPDSRPASPDSTTPSVPASSITGCNYAEIEKRCGATSDPVECVTLFSPLSDKKDPIVVLKAGLNAVANLSKQALEKADVLKKDPKTTVNTGSCLSVCIENYYSVPDNTDQALKAIEKKDMDSLKTYLSADVTSITTCIDVHDKNKSPLKEVDSTLLGLVRANLQIATTMVKF